MENKIEIYRNTDNQTEITVQFDEDTVWLSQQQLSELFERDRTVISRHIHNIFEVEELEKQVVSAKFAHTTQHGVIKGKTQLKETEYYNPANPDLNSGLFNRGSLMLSFCEWLFAED